MKMLPMKSYLMTQLALAFEKYFSFKIAHRHQSANSEFICI